jgi:two-component system sensor histidine kinase DegS
VWHRGLTAAESGWLVTGLFFLAVVTVLAYWYAVTERARVDEMTSLREQVALADYRSALSQELHDGVQHYLVAAVVRLEMARKVGEQDASQAVDMAVNVRHTLRQASDELRYLVRRLRSPHIERHGFLQALREHLSLYAEHAPFTVDLQVEAEEAQLPPEVEQIAFRIIQEALTNAEKHASPTEVRVSVRLTPERLECSIGDNGSGFEPAEGPEQPDLTHGLGLAGMRHRAESVDGKLEVESAPGAGTRVRLTVPVAQYVAHKEEQVAKYQGAPG